MKKTNIQWCDSTVNPIMGCLGCELLPSAQSVLREIDRRVKQQNSHWRIGTAEAVLERLIDQAVGRLGEKVVEIGHYDQDAKVTNLYHLRNRLAAEVSSFTVAGSDAIVLDTVREQLKCYAWELHANKALDITKGWRKGHKGYAKSFNKPKRFPGRMAEAAAYGPPTTKDREGREWFDDLPRLIFVSDMGDAFSKASDFEFIA